MARTVAAGALGALIATEQLDFGTGLQWLVLGLTVAAVLTSGAAALQAGRAGLAAGAQRVLLGALVWLGLVIASHLMAQDEGASFKAPLQVMTDLLALAWCALLGRAVSAVGAPDARLLRALAMIWLVLHALLQLIPLAGLAALGVGLISAISIGAAIVPFGSAVVDAHRVLRALGQAPALVPAQAQDGATTTDDPWRPGA